MYQLVRTLTVTICRRFTSPSAGFFCLLLDQPLPLVSKTPSNFVSLLPSYVTVRRQLKTRIWMLSSTHTTSDIGPGGSYGKTATLKDRAAAATTSDVSASTATQVNRLSSCRLQTYRPYTNHTMQTTKRRPQNMSLPFLVVDSDITTAPRLSNTLGLYRALSITWLSLPEPSPKFSPPIYT